MQLPESPPTLEPELYEEYRANVAFNTELIERSRQVAFAESATEQARDQRFDRVMFAMSHAAVCKSVSEFERLLYSSTSPEFLLPNGLRDHRDVQELEPRIASKNKLLVPLQRFSPYNTLQRAPAPDQLMGILVLATAMQPNETAFTPIQERQLIDTYEAFRQANTGSYITSVWGLLKDSGDLLKKVDQTMSKSGRFKRLFSFRKMPQQTAQDEDRQAISTMQIDISRFKGRHFKTFSRSLREEPLLSEIPPIAQTFGFK